MENDHSADVELTCQCAPVMLDLDSVTALGLVVSELVANSYAHAVPKRRGVDQRVIVSGPIGAKRTPRLFSPMTVPVLSERGDSARHGLQLVRTPDRSRSGARRRFVQIMAPSGP